MVPRIFVWRTIVLLFVLDEFIAYVADLKCVNYGSIGKCDQRKISKIMNKNDAVVQWTTVNQFLSSFFCIKYILLVFDKSITLFNNTNVILVQENTQMKYVELVIAIVVTIMVKILILLSKLTRNVERLVNTLGCEHTVFHPKLTTLIIQ